MLEMILSMTTQNAPYPQNAHYPPNSPYPPQGGHAPYPGPPAQPPRRRTNVVGIIALVVAVIGFIFACVPGALILGWIMLPIAFVLSLVGLFLRDRARWTAITALIVSIVGTIVGVLVFFFAVVNAFDESFGGSSATVDDSAAEAGAESVAMNDADEAVDDSAAVGKPGESRENPVPLGTTVSGDEWDVTVVEFNADADDEVLAANMFNEPAADGYTYVTAEVEVAYYGEESDDPSWSVSVEYVTDSGNVISTADTMAVAPEPSIHDIGEMYAGATGTGNVVLEVPEDDTGVLRVSPGMIADSIFVSTE